MVKELSISDSLLSGLAWFKSIDRILKRAKFDNYYDIYQYEDKGYVGPPNLFVASPFICMKMTSLSK